MSRRRRDVALVMAMVFAVAIGGFALLQEGSRRVETSAAVGLLRLIGTDRVTLVHGTTAVVAPRGGSPFLASVSPSCSALASILALACLAFLVPKAPLPRRIAALAAAIAVVYVGNILRIAGSLGVGIFRDRATLILFHDAVGSMFAFAYILGGYILMLYVLLPHRRLERAFADA